MDLPTRILLVEDNPGDGRLLAEMLAETGMSESELVRAETLQSGLAHMAEGAFDVVLLDLSLPDSEGLESFRKVHACTPWIPVIVLTGNRDEALALSAVREGAQDYLVKGQVDGPMLARSLRYAMERSRASAALERSEHELKIYRTRLEEMVERRTAELERVNRDLEQASRAKSEFLAGMSHELRTPLNSILGFSGIMLQGLAGELTDEQRTQLTMVQRSGRRLLALVNDVLDLSRIEAGRVTRMCSRFDVAPIVASCVDTVSPLAREKSLRIRAVLPKLSLSMHSDEAKVQQVLINLLANAVKFTEDGLIGIEVRVSRDDIVSFVVSDTGIGMTEDQIGRVFADFVQIVPEGAKPEGTGLGLAISRRLAKMLGGEITVSSRPGVGSRFVFTLPRECPSDEEMEGESSQAASEQASDAIPAL